MIRSLHFRAATVKTCIISPSQPRKFSIYLVSTEKSEIVIKTYKGISDTETRDHTHIGHYWNIVVQYVAIMFSIGVVPCFCVINAFLTLCYAVELAHGEKEHSDWFP